MKRTNPGIEYCAFTRNLALSEENKRTVQRFKLHALLDKIQENINELKKAANDKK